MTNKIDAEGYDEIFEYNQNSRPIYFRDKNHNERFLHYDLGGNLKGINDPLGKNETYIYYPNGRVMSFTDANMHSTNFYYDPNGNLSSIQVPSSTGSQGFDTTQFSFDARSKITQRIDASNQPTNYVYNSQDELQDAIYADGTSDHREYYSTGNLSLIRDRRQKNKTFNYDADSDLTDVYEVNGTIHTQYTYDPIFNRTSIINAKSKATSYVYNEQLKIKSIIDPIGQSQNYVYDGALRLKSKTDSRGVLVSLDYYKNDRLKTLSYSGSNGGVIQYTYDGNGNRATMTDSEGMKTYTYNGLDRLIGIQNPAENFNLNYTYDLVGNRLTMQNNLIGGTETYGYYPNNRLETVTDFDSQSVTYVYNAMQQTAEVDYPNGIAKAVYAYNPQNHFLTSLQNLNSKNEIISSFMFQRDQIGNPVTITGLNGPVINGYDDLNQLTSVTYPGPRGSVSYSYDSAGNRMFMTGTSVSGSYTYDDANEIMTASMNINGNITSINFGHDGAGNEMLLSGPSYVWDGLNRQLGLTDGSISYNYNGNDQRIQKTKNGVVTKYRYDGNQVLYEIDATGNIKKKYVPGISVADSNKKLFYLFDDKGDVVNLIDRNGNIVKAYSYDPFGQAFGVNADLNGSRFVGEYAVFSDDDLNLQYMWHRWYDPSVGRFLSRDKFEGSILQPTSTNKYIYALNCPLGFIDPKGLWTVSVGLSANIGSFSFSIAGNYGYSQKDGFSSSFTGTGGASQSTSSYSPPASVNVSFSNAPDVSGLNGIFSITGANLVLASAEGFTSIDGSVQGAQLSISPDLSLPGIYSGASNTLVLFNSLYNGDPDDDPASSNYK